MEDRRLEAQELFNAGGLSIEDGPGSETELSRTLVYWKSCPFGHPDDRVGESQSTVLTDEILGYLANDLSIDGEVN